MKRSTLFVGISLLALALSFPACTKVALTGRNQLNLIPDSEMMTTSYQQYSEVLASSKLSSDTAAVHRVRKVGQRIQHAVEDYFKSTGQEGKLKDYKWEFNVIESKEVNAWCMPGGKVAFYSGILPVCQDENGIAVVMGHEVSHAVAQHGSERMSQQLIAEMGSMALSEALAKEPQQTKSLWMTVFGAGAQFGALLPFSRTQESEADHLGLVFMAMAGYDPHSALTFWQRMSEQSGGTAPPEFMSTHPSDATRIKKIQELMPEAMKAYRPHTP